MILKNFYKEKRKIRILIIYITLIIVLIENLSSFDISSSRWSKPIPITILNSSADDYAPNYNVFDNLLYFSSSRSGNTYFYKSTFENNDFQSPILLKSSINQTAKHQNYISFLSSELAYFTSFKSTNNYPVLNIFKSYYVKNSWTDGVIDDTLNIGESNAQLTISPDKSTAIFITNKNNKKEDTDLWMIQKNEDGDWSIPVKLNEINTPSREITPFLKSSDTLFFASDGFGGPGGFDLFVTVKVNGVWQRPTPLFDLNTEFNESDITFLPNNSMILASDRPGGMGGYDLYHTNNEERVIENKEFEKPELNILSQTNVIQAERIINSQIYHFPVTFPISIINLDEDSNFLNYFKESISVVGARLKRNPTAFVQITKSPLDSVFINFFLHSNISDDRYQFIDSSDKYITLKSNNNELFDFIEINNSEVNLKPPALDININNRNSAIIDELNIYLEMGSTKSEIDVHADSLPMRFIYDIEPFANKIYNSDSLSIKTKFKYSGLQDSVDRVIQIIKSETKTSIRKDDNGKFIDFVFYIPTLSDFNNFTNIHENYLKRINQEMDISKRIILFYYNQEGQEKAKALVSKIIKSRKYIEINLAPIDKFIIPEESKHFFKLRIEKY